MQSGTQTTATTLDRIPPGSAAVVLDVTGEEGPTSQRLCELGLLDGERVAVVRVAPAGDPVEIELRGYRLSMRRAEARLVEVEPQDAA